VWTDASGNIRPNKAKSADKIDGIVAAIMALGVFRWREHAGPSVYEERGILLI
jgi:phage terminase large subunit-like protein